MGKLYEAWQNLSNHWTEEHEVCNLCCFWSLHGRKDPRTSTPLSLTQVRLHKDMLYREMVPPHGLSLEPRNIKNDMKLHNVVLNRTMSRESIEIMLLVEKH